MERACDQSELERDLSLLRRLRSLDPAALERILLVMERRLQEKKRPF